MGLEQDICPLHSSGGCACVYVCAHGGRGRTHICILGGRQVASPCSSSALTLYQGAHALPGDVAQETHEDYSN